MVLYSKHLYDVDLIQIKKQIIGSDHSSELSDFFKATVNEIEIYLSNLDQEEQTTKKELLFTTDLLGRETNNQNQPLIYFYNDGTVEKKVIIE